jgi:diguanylate cyclase (GGDEF)-like protein
VRVDIENRIDHPTDWMLEIPFPTLDNVEVFLVDTGKNEILYNKSAGDLKPFSQRPYPHRHFVFPMTLPPVKSLAYILRVDSRGSLTIPSVLWPPALFNQNSQNAYLVLSLYFGILIALFAYNFLLYFSLGDRVYLYYVLFVGGMALAQFSWNGLGFEYLWPDSTSWGNVASIAGFDATGLFGVVFSRAFLGTSRSAPALDKALFASGAVFAILLVTIPFTSYQFNAVSTSVNGVIFPLVAITSGVVCLARGFKSARFFLLAWSLLLFGSALLGARNMGFVPTNFVTLHALLIGSALEVILLSFALAERISDLRREKEAAQMEAFTVKKAMIETLERKEKELDDRVHIRTRELQDLNLRLMESETHLRKMANHDYLTGLANRSLLEESLILAIERAKRNKSRIAVLLADLDGFKPVNDNHGHDVGDDLLRIIASRLKAAVRSSDTVARIGGDEFVLLLDTIKYPIDAVHMAEKVLAAIREPANVRGSDIQVSASIGVAVFPDDGTEAETLVKHADRAMYDAKLSGRNQLKLAAGLSAGLDNIPQ